MRRGCRSIILTAAAAWLVSALAPAAFAQDAAAPGNPPLAHLKAYVEAFNSGVPGQMKAFFEAHFAASALKEVPLQQRLTRFRGAKAQLKSLQIERVVSDEPLHASLLTKSGDGGFLLLNGTVEKTPPYKLLTLMIDMVEDPDEIIAPRSQGRRQGIRPPPSRPSSRRGPGPTSSRGSCSSPRTPASCSTKPTGSPTGTPRSPTGRTPSSISARSTRASPGSPSTSSCARASSRSTTRSRRSCPTTPTPRPPKR